MANTLNENSEDSSTFSASSGEIVDINVTPFVDVVLVLLVIFMVTAPMMVKEVVGISLPKVSTPSSKTTPPQAIAINQEGSFFWNGEPIEDVEVATRASTALTKDPETQVVISADEEAKHKFIMRAIDLLREAGVKKYALQVKRTQKK